MFNLLLRLKIFVSLKLIFIFVQLFFCILCSRIFIFKVFFYTTKIFFLKLWPSRKLNGRPLIKYFNARRNVTHNLRTKHIYTVHKSIVIDTNIYSNVSACSSETPNTVVGFLKISPQKCSRVKVNSSRAQWSTLGVFCFWKILQQLYKYLKNKSKLYLIK